MRTRQDVLNYGLSFPDTYQDAPFHDDNWQLVRVRKRKKVFLWTLEYSDFGWNSTRGRSKENDSGKL